MTTTPDGMDERSVIGGIELRLMKARQGVRKVLDRELELVVGEKKMKAAEVDDELLRRRLRYSDAREARVRAQQNSEVRDLEEPATKGFLGDLSFAVAGHLGPRNPVLLEFGFKPAKRPARLSPEKLVERAAKARETRARNDGLRKSQKESRTKAKEHVIICPEEPATLAKATHEAARNGV